MSEIDNKERLMKVLLAPHISEKSSIVQSDRQYVFKVLPFANKHEIAQAVKLLFNVEVESVQVVNSKGKRKHFARMLGRRKDFKKAYVKLAEGNEIEFADQAKA